MTSSEIRERFLKFFEKRGHAIVPSASLVPENDPSALFTTAGMQPLVPYLMGEPHPSGKRLVNVQKCVRTVDIEEIGDNTHATFFEMMGNWSLGDYFKEDAIKWSYEFLTSKEEGLGLDPARLYVTVFEGDENAPRDDESANIWKKIFSDAGTSGERIYFLPAKSNWWSPGDNGPCGPDSEMFYDVTGKLTAGMTKEEYLAADERQDVVEIWNDVFMEYEKKDGYVIGRLAQQNVDTGSGLERVTMVVQGKDNIFDTDLLAPLMKTMEVRLPYYGSQTSIVSSERERRIIADHMRTAVMMIADGVIPSNTDRGYILRRLIRRMVVKAGGKLTPENVAALVAAVAGIYSGVYDKVGDNIENIAKEINREIEKFNNTLPRGMKELSKIPAGGMVSGAQASMFFTTYGLPFEMITELAKERNISVDEIGFREEMKKHQALSRAGAVEKFKGGLADTSEKTVMLHTCTHLMLAGLRKYLGDHIHQAGSNITVERTRFDFTHPEKVPRETLDKVEAYVNEAIGKGCAVSIEQMPKADAQARDVEGSFWEKYPDMVNVYVVKAPEGVVYSQELCGGPHVGNTSAIKGTFKIVKEEASSAGVRRIKAVLE